MNPSNPKQMLHAVACAIGGLFIGVGGAQAQTPPDAGSVLQQIEQQRRQSLPTKAPPLTATPPPPMQALPGATVRVNVFNFAGNTLISADKLAPVVAGFQNRPLDFAELQGAAVAVATAYRKAGWVVKVYLPRQDVTGGIVTIQIVEAVFGTVRLEGTPRRISEDHLMSVVEAAQARGAPLNGDALDRALLLIGDLPGMRVTGRMTEGTNQAETNLLLTVNDGSPFSGDLSGDNIGSRSTGATRVSASVNLNSPLNLGDLAGINLMHTQGSDYVRASYALPLGFRGWRVGMNASQLSYKVLTPEFSQLDPHGTSRTVGADVSYPLLRSRLKNLYFSATFDEKGFDNQSSGTTTTNYKVQVASLGLNGNLFDEWGGGGANSASLVLMQGRVDLAGSPNEAADAASTQTAGGFRKLRFGASRQQAMTEAVSLFGSLSGQWASKNLDSSEKFYLGGAGGVRAYPASEGGGASGFLINLEVRKRLPAGLNLAGFIDMGSVHVNKNNGITGAAVPNSYSLRGMGISLAWAPTDQATVKLTLARRLGSNPNPTVTGNDQDGSLTKNRVWLQANASF